MRKIIIGALLLALAPAARGRAEEARVALDEATELCRQQGGRTWRERCRAVGLDLGAGP